jgi:hypothetical protein
MKCKPQQSLFIAIASDPIRDVKEWLLEELAILEDADASNFFDNKEPTRSVSLQVNRAV